jgi:hypothetical protein
MKNLITSLLLLFSASAFSQHPLNSIQAGAGYTRDFPGLNGYTIRVQFAHQPMERLQVGVGVQSVDASGFPRTKSVKEFTRARTLDLFANYSLISSESHYVRVGAGYAFSYYNIRRAYPVVGPTEYQWPSQDVKGSTSGLIFSAEYEHILPGELFGIGGRISSFKAFDHLFVIGVFGTIHF